MCYTAGVGFIALTLGKGMDMDWVVPLIQVVAGIGCLTLGGDYIVRGSVVVAGRLGVSAVVTGAVIVGFGTSLPELLVTMQASLAGKPDIGVGNVVGSNIANFLFILCFGLVLMPIATADAGVRRGAVACVVAALVLGGVAYIGGVSRLMGGVMVAGLMCYLVFSFVLARSKHAGEAEGEGEGDSWGYGLSGLVILIAIILLPLGADLLIGGASALALQFGISQAVIGLSLVAIATSLPELAAAAAAVLRQHGSVVLSSVLGSTLFNILSILGITALVVPVPIAASIARGDVPVSIAVIVGMAGLICWRKRLTRPVGVVGLLGYCLYLVWLFSR